MMRISTSRIEEQWKLPNGSLRNMRHLTDYPDKDENGDFDYVEINNFLIRHKAIPALAKETEKATTSASDYKAYQALNEKLKSDKQQLELQQLRGELIEVNYVQQELGRFLINLKEGLITQTLARINDIYEAETIEHARMSMKSIIVNAINFNAKQNQDLLTSIKDEPNAPTTESPSEPNQDSTDE